MKHEYISILKKYNIKNLYHFTSVNNLDSILNMGLCNRKYMDNKDIKYEYTDKDRLDNQKECLSLSLNYSNRSLIKYKNKNMNTDWIILQFDANEIISNYYDKIYYCKYNASSPSVANILNKNRNYLKTKNAFDNMFDFNGQMNFQAELLLEGIIPSNFIKNIFVDSLQLKLIVEQLLEKNDMKNINVIIKKEMF